MTHKWFEKKWPAMGFALRQGGAQRKVAKQFKMSLRIVQI